MHLCFTPQQVINCADDSGRLNNDTLKFHHPAMERHHVIIFTDPGEEIDDEIALWAADQLFSSLAYKLKSCVCQGRQYSLHVVVVDGKMSAGERLSRCKAVLGEPRSIKYWTPEKFDPNLMAGSSVLIIGPMELGENSEKIISDERPPDLVVLAGTKHCSVNWGQNELAQKNCEKLLSVAKQSYIIQSHRLSQETMTTEFVKKLPKKLNSHVAALTWRFLLGRASGPAEFVAHLLSPTLAGLKDRPASNFVAIQSVYEFVYSDKKLDDIEISDKAWQLSKEYYENDLEGFTDYVLKASKEVIKKEYAQATEALLRLGWYTDKVLLSTDPQLSDEVLLKDRPLEFMRFKEKVFSEIGSPLPCYDHTAFREFMRYVVS